MTLQKAITKKGIFNTNFAFDSYNTDKYNEHSWCVSKLHQYCMELKFLKIVVAHRCNILNIIQKYVLKIIL